MADTSYSLSPGLFHFDYTEFDTNDTLLDREQGWLPGIKLKLNHQLSDDYLISISSAYYQGTVTYDGQTQSGTPHITDTDTQLFRLGARFQANIYSDIDLFIGTRLHQWIRDIKDKNSISGITETYRWEEYSIGLNANIFIRKNDALNIDIAYLLTRYADMKADLSRIDAGTTVLNLGDGDGARLKLEWSRKSSNERFYGLSIFVESWDFGRSNTRFTQGGATNLLITEPKSETRNTGLEINFGYNFLIFYFDMMKNHCLIGAIRMALNQNCFTKKDVHRNAEHTEKTYVFVKYFNNH